MHQWQFQKAKAEVSKLVKHAQTEGPQLITVHGSPSVVVISKKEYDRKTQSKKKFVEFIQSSPLAGLKLTITRDKSSPRKIKL